MDNSAMCKLDCTELVITCCTEMATSYIPETQNSSKMLSLSLLIAHCSPFSLIDYNVLKLANM